MHTAVKAIECLAGKVLQRYWVAQAVKNVRRVRIQAWGSEVIGCYLGFSGGVSAIGGILLVFGPN